MSRSLQRIMAGVATPDRGDPVLAPVLRLAERTGAELYLVHVFGGSNHGGGTGPELEQRLKQAAAALSPRVPVHCQAVAGRAGEVLPRMAGELAAQVLVLAHTRRGSAGAAVLGTTAQRVLRASHVPVLSLDAGGGRAPTRALLATDLSPHSAHALRAGAALAVALAHPVAPRLHPLYVTMAPYETAVAGLAERTAECAAEELRDFIGGVPELAGVEGSLRSGEPAERILHEAALWKADLLVLGTHARRGVPRLLLGSVAERVLRRAHCSVLVIPPATPQPAAPALPPVVETAHAPAAKAALPVSAVATAAPRPRPRSVVPTHAVLAATDLSSASDHVLRSAAAVAAATGAELHVIHAFDFSSPEYMGATVERVTFQARIAAAEEALDAQLAATVPPEVTIGSRRVEIYAAHRAIAEQAAAVGAELVVLGAHTYRGSHLGVLGSTTDRLVRTLQVPCLVVRTELALPLHRVVAPTDLSLPSRAGVAVALRWARALGTGDGPAAHPTEVEVVHVAERRAEVGEDGGGADPIAPGLNRMVDAAVRALGAPAATLVREQVRWSDHPAREIVSLAWRERADLLVLATHGHGPLRRGLLGSTAWSVLRRASCPVLLVPTALWKGKLCKALLAGHGAVPA